MVRQFWSPYHFVEMTISYYISYSSLTNAEKIMKESLLLFSVDEISCQDIVG